MIPIRSIVVLLLLAGVAAPVRSTGTGGPGPELIAVVHTMPDDPDGPLSRPRGIAIGWEGQIYVADSGNDRVVVLDSLGGFVSQIGFAGSGDGRFVDPSDVAVEGLHLFVLDEGNERIQVFDRYEVFSQVILSREGGGIGIPLRMAADPFGRIYVSDREEDLIRVFRSFTREEEMRVGGYGSRSGQFRHPSDIDIDRERRIYVADTDNDRVQIFDPLGGFLRSIGKESPSPEGSLRAPAAVAVDRRGGVLVADTGNDRIAFFDSEGAFVGEFDGRKYGLALRGPEDVAVTDHGLIYISDTGNDRLLILREQPSDDKR